MRRPVVSLLSTATFASVALLLTACGASSPSGPAAAESPKSPAAVFPTSPNDATNGALTTTDTVTLADQPVVITQDASILARGDSMYRKITVQNPGSRDIRYALTNKVDEGKSSGRGKATTFAVAALPKVGAKCDPSVFETGKVLIKKNTSLADGTVFGDPATGKEDGDRALAAGASEALCLRLALPVDAPASITDATATAMFTFTTETTSN